ncbi:MAG: hypothetical protein M0D55_04990 [Elusimicrobiota bacterium]|nr:MAG: hypothetical protein M0D55_04990 [Elusimicrobiota bacterium]
MRTIIAAALLGVITAGTSASAEPAHLSNDPLTSQIMSRQLTSPGGGVTAAVRIGSGQAITLQLADPLSASTDTLKDAVAEKSALAPLAPAAGLSRKPAKKARRVRNDREKLGDLSDAGRKADWAGRK